MKIWLATIGEPVPVAEGRFDRLHRTGQLAMYLASQSHDVTWWTSTFDHFRKKHLFDTDTIINLRPRLQIRLLHGCGYSRNVSLARLLDHRQIARRFSRLAPAQLAPDIVVAALPAVELARACVDYGVRYDVPVVVDLRDMWPDIFVEHLPKAIAPFARQLLAPLYAEARRACRGASAITGITEAFVDWGLRRGDRSRTELDRAIPLSYSPDPPAPERLAEAARFWDHHGITAGSGEPVICFFGALGRQFDFDHVIDAARLLNTRGTRVRFVVCGSGERLNELRNRASGVPNVLLPGWVDQAQIHVLMRRSKAGLDPLQSRFDFLATVNNKAIEYFSAGLPVISSPKAGLLFELLRDRGCGASYEPGDAVGLADLTEALVSDPPTLSRMSAASTRLFHERFSADVVNQTALRMFRDAHEMHAVLA